MRPLFLFTLFVAFSAACAQTLVRKDFVGLSLSETPNGLFVDSVTGGGSAAQFDVKKGDILLSVNNRQVGNLATYHQIAGELRAGDELSVELSRSGRTLKRKTITIARPLERSPHADIIYDWIPFRGGYLRTIVRKPKNRERSPAILLIPGYGCGSIENFSKSYNGPLMDAWLKSGYAVITVEKSGLGDSFGCVPCSEADLATDIDSYTAGYRYMETLPFVDPRQLFIWGHSLGGMIAPEIARSYTPKGVMVYGTVFRPWSEFLPEMHRVQKPLLEKKNYVETETFIRKIQKIYYEFFVLKKTREELYANPEYTEIVASELEYQPGSSNMWGRHWRFWQQIDSLNLARSWSNVKCPVLVINGGTDYEQCAQIEPKLIEETVNYSHPGNATRLEIPDLDHFMMKSGTFREAADNFRTREFLKGNFNSRIATETVNWLNKQTNKS